MFDVIEHIPQAEALQLLEKLKARTKCIILFTLVGDTLGYFNDSRNMGNIERQTHKSVWYPESFEGFDITVIKNFHTHVKSTPVDALWAVRIGV
jgi:hypothetical protein